MQIRNTTNGQYKRKSKGILPLLSFFILLGITLYFAGNKDAVVTTTEPNYTQEAQLSPDVIEYMNSPEFKLEMELRARTNVLTTKKKVEQDLNKKTLAELKTEYESKVLDENDRNRAKISDIEVELEDIRKQELEIGAKNKSSLK